ncbi:MAG: DUF1648 domain-containing protein [Sphingomonadaceae bacterium]|jgi:hypothetical protein
MTAAIGSLIVAVFYTIVMIAMSVRAAGRLPADGKVPIHFNMKGEADSFGNRWVTLALLPALYAIIAAVSLIPVFAGAQTRGPGGIVVGMIVTGAIVVGAHALVIALLLRWADKQN